MWIRLKADEMKIEKQNGRKGDGYMWHVWRYWCAHVWFGERSYIVSHTVSAAAVNDAPYELFAVHCWFRVHFERVPHISSITATEEIGVLALQCFVIPTTEVNGNRLAHFSKKVMPIRGFHRITRNLFVFDVKAVGGSQK